MVSGKTKQSSRIPETALTTAHLARAPRFGWGPPISTRFLGDHEGSGPELGLSSSNLMQLTQHLRTVLSHRVRGRLPSAKGSSFYLK